MPEVILYLIKANIALCLFYLAYRLGLRRLTFYTLNRFFLLSGIVFSSLFPLVDVNGFFNRNDALAQQVITYVPDINAWQAAPPEAFSAWALLEWVFWAGVGVMFLRLMVQLASLLLLHRKTAPGTLLERNVRVMGKAMNPFSFFRNIYVNPSLHTDQELEAILDHEAVHVKEWHSADVLLGELNNVFYWFNPGAWLMKTAIRENLEFLTDRAILRSGMDPKAYQYSLIQVNASQHTVGIANNFNFSHLKNRIMMMNKRKSSRLHIYRYALLACLVCGVLLSLNFTKPGTVMNDVVTEVRTVLADGGNAVTGAFSGNGEAPAGTQISAVPAARRDTTTPVERRKVVIRNDQTGKQDTVHFSASSVTVVNTGNMSTINGEGKAARAGTGTFTGKVAGVAIIGNRADTAPRTSVTLRSAGNAGAKPANIMINCKTCDSTRTKPLFVLDGEVYDKELTTMDPNTIESITVLKDKSATAIYGARGENGVILITTKTGAGAKSVNNGVREVTVTGRPSPRALTLSTTTVTADSAMVITAVGRPSNYKAAAATEAVTLESIYPNPTTGLVNFSFSVPKAGNGFIEVVNLEGKRVYYKSLNGFSGIYRGNIDLTGRPAGTYILNISLPGQARMSSKIVKQ
jgi:TonB-dependent SusC/RagA subfamily outer membrane receptor